MAGGNISSEKIDLLIYGPSKPIVDNGFSDQFVLHSFETTADLERLTPAVAEKIRKAISQVRIRRVDRNEYLGNVTLSVGVACAQPGDVLEKLIERADAALYAAKRAGRNRVSVGDGGKAGGS